MDNTLRERQARYRATRKQIQIRLTQEQAERLDALRGEESCAQYVLAIVLREIGGDPAPPE